MFTKSQFEELWNRTLNGKRFRYFEGKITPVRAMLILLADESLNEEGRSYDIPNLNKVCVKEFVEKWLEEAKTSETVYEVVSKKYQAAGDADVYYFNYDYATTAPIYAIRTVERLKEVLEINLKEGE